jgi:hypothetical protein
MTGRTLGIAMLVACCAPALADAQRTRPLPERMQRLELTLFGGGTAYTDIHRTMLAPASVSAAGEPAPPGAPQLRRVSAETAPTFGAALGYWVTRDWGVRLHAALAPSRFHVVSGAPREDRRLDASADSGRLAPLMIWTADAALLFRLPLGLDGVLPYGLAGAGTLEYRARPADPDEIPPEAAAGIGTGAYGQLVGVLGLGAAVPVSWRNSLLSFELTTHFGRPPGRASDAALAAGAMPDRRVPDGDVIAEHGPGDPSLTSQVRFLVGLTVPLFGDRMRAGGPPAPPVLQPAPVPTDGVSARAPADGSTRARRSPGR